MTKQIRWIPLLLALATGTLALLLLLSVLFGNELFPEYSPADRGADVAYAAGCFSCHSSDAVPGASNPYKSTEGVAFRPVPSMFDKRHSLEELREWIEDGVSQTKSQSPVYIEAKGGEALRMPGFKNRLSSDEIDDLMAFVALMQYRVSAARNAPESHGEELARRFSCFTCHGELGQGGVGNPGALKGYIPGFFGTDFRALTRNGNSEDLREWIVDGASHYFLNQGFAGFYPGRYFSRRQAIQMPAFKDYLTDEEVEKLVDFVGELLSRGPLTAADIHRYRPIGGVSSTSVPQQRPQRGGTGSLQGPSLPQRALSILESYCLECHGPQKQRSSYRMDNQEAAFKGGEIADFLSTSAIVPGSSSESLLIRFVEALEEDLDSEVYPMPPAGNPRLDQQQIQTLRAWIDSGARWPQAIPLDSDPEDN